MPTVFDAIGVKPKREAKTKNGKTKQATWLAGQSTAAGERPMGEYKEFYDALGRLFDATDELEAGNNNGFTHKARPGLMDVIIGLSPNGRAPDFFLVTADMLTEEALEKLLPEEEEAEDDGVEEDGSEAESD